MYEEEYNEYGIEISQEIKDDVHEYKKKTTKFMDKVKTTFFIYYFSSVTKY